MFYSVAKARFSDTFTIVKAAAAAGVILASADPALYAAASLEGRQRRSRRAGGGELCKPGAGRVIRFSREKIKKDPILEKNLLTRAITRYILEPQSHRGVVNMKAVKIVDEIMRGQGKSKAELGRAVGIPTEKNPTDVINKRLKQENISVNVMLEMLGAMGYTMVVVPTGSKLKDGEYEVTIDE